MKANKLYLSYLNRLDKKREQEALRNLLRYKRI